MRTQAIVDGAILDGTAIRRVSNDADSGQAARPREMFARCKKGSRRDDGWSPEVLVVSRGGADRLGDAPAVRG
jgi:hypothetical protein